MREVNFKLFFTHTHTQGESAFTSLERHFSLLFFQYSLIQVNHVLEDMERRPKSTVRSLLLKV